MLKNKTAFYSSFLKLNNQKPRKKQIKLCTLVKFEKNTKHEKAFFPPMKTKKMNKDKNIKIHN